MLLSFFVLFCLWLMPGFSRGAFAQEGATEPPKEEGAAPATRPEKGAEELPDKRGAKAVDEFLRDRFERVKTLYASDQFKAAFQLADALLVVAPDVIFREELRRLRRLAEGRHLGLSLIAAHFELNPEDTSYPRKSIVGELILVNLTTQDIQVGAKGERQVLGQARYRLTEFYVNGSEWSVEGTKNLSSDSGFTLKAGETRRVPATIELPPGGVDPVAQRISVRGKIRAAQLSLPDQNIPRSIPWQETNMILTQPELEDARQDPYKHLQLGLLGMDFPRSVFATQLLRRQLEEERLTDDEQDRVVDLLVESFVETNPRLNAVVFRLLEAFTGVRCASRVESWRLWASLRKVDARRQDGERAARDSKKPRGKKEQ